MSIRTTILPLLVAGVTGAGVPIPVFAATIVFGADPLGTVFSTPQERRKLDEAREQAARAGTLVIVPDAPEPEQEPVEQPEQPGIRVKGVVSRRDGPDTAWVNEGNTLQMDSTARILKVETIEKDPGAVRIGLPDGESSRTVRVGETFEPQQEKVVDLIDPYSNPGAPARGRSAEPEAEGEQ